MSKYISTELALAIAQLEAKARLGGEPEPEDTRRPQRREWDVVDAYEPEDIGSAISNAVRASRRLAAKRK